MVKKTTQKIRDGTHSAHVSTQTKHHKHGSTTMQVAEIDGHKFYRIVSNKKK